MTGNGRYERGGDALLNLPPGIGSPGPGAALLDRKIRPALKGGFGIREGVTPDLKAREAAPRKASSQAFADRTANRHR